MGEVWRAHDARLGRDVAIKSLPGEFARDPERLLRFQREAQTLASLNHPNIAAIYGLEDHDGSPHLVLELVEGETLGARLARGPLGLETALEVGSQIAAAIEAAHERGIVHRDLKPGNVMFSGSGHIKVLDFGLAKVDVDDAPASDSSQLATMPARAGETVAGAILGTAAYMSPEQARGKPVDRRSDVWSFGCVLFECLAGRAAFTGETVSDLLARILEREPDWNALPSAVPARVREVLRRCLRKDSSARPRDIRDVRIELAEAALGNRTSDTARERSIAVLPFENQSSSEDEYFSDGVTDEILNALAHLDGLRVAARSSCFAFKGKREDLRTIGERLDVATVLEGTVRRSGSRLRITAQLVNAADGYQMWSERYDREMTDVFELQDEIANAIALRLRGALADEDEKSKARSGTKNIEAYEMFLRGRALQHKRGRFMHEAVQCLERAIELDPGFAEPKAWLADSYRLMSTFGSSPYSEVMPLAKRLAREALAIDDSIADAWATLACVLEQHDWCYELSDRYWERALGLEPRHARSRAQRALWGYARGNWSADKALTETRQAIHDDPLNDWVIAMHSHVLGFVGQHEESIAQGERAHALEPDSFFSHWNLVRAHAWAGDLRQAIDMAPALLRASGRQQWGLGVLGWAYGQAGESARARAVYDELEARSRHEFVAPSWLATTAAGAGLTEAAEHHLVQSVQMRDPLTLWGRRSPFWIDVRKLERFEAITAPAHRDHSSEASGLDLLR